MVRRSSRVSLSQLWMASGKIGGEKMDEATRREIAEVEASVQGRKDVVTIAKACRGGLMTVEILPLTNGFMVTLRSPNPTEPTVYQTFVFTRAEKIGTLIHTLYNSDLNNPKATARLRRLMGYL